MLKLELELSRERPPAYRILPVGVMFDQEEHTSDMILHLGRGSARWISSIDWSVFALATASLAYLRRMTVYAYGDEEEAAFMQHAIEPLKAICSEQGQSLSVRNMGN